MTFPSCLSQCDETPVDDSLQAVLMQDTLNKSPCQLPSCIRSLQQDNRKSRRPWNELLRFLKAPVRVTDFYGRISAKHIRTLGTGCVQSQFRLSHHRERLAMCWPRIQSRTSAINMGGSSPTQRKPRQEQQAHHVYLENDHLKKLHHELQKGRELSEATDDLLRQEYHQLLLKFDSQKEMSAAQKKEIEFYRHIISNTSPIEVNRHMDEMEERLRQFCDNLGWFTNEHSRIVRENITRSQNKFSMRDTLGSLARSLESATALSEENKNLKRRLPLKPEILMGSEKEELGSTADSEERVWGGTSTIHRKKGSSNLRSQDVIRHAPHSNGLHEQLEQSQDLSDVERLAHVPTSQANLVVSLQSRLESAQTHIINLGGNLGSLLPREEVKKVRSE